MQHANMDRIYLTHICVDYRSFVLQTHLTVQIILI